jgi:hypothetical protein
MLEQYDTLVNYLRNDDGIRITSELISLTNTPFYIKITRGMGLTFCGLTMEDHLKISTRSALKLRSLLVRP